jgi:hypothetical protein
MSSLSISSFGSLGKTDQVSDMAPLELAIMLMSHDLGETQRPARSLLEQRRILETMARTLAVFAQ